MFRFLPLNDYQQMSWFGRTVLTALLCTIGFGYSSSVQAIETETVTYQDGEVTMRGYRAYPAGQEEARPGILIIHQWKGLGDYEKRRARQLARMGYVAFAGDIYGADTRPSTNHEAAMASSTFRENRNFYRKRAKLALNVLRDDDRVRTDDLAAIGYCFGGTGVLELARSGTRLDAVVSFHGGLTKPAPEENQTIHPVVQVHHGANDPHVSQQNVRAFWDEMKNSDADWDLNIYGHAVHSFTREGAGDDPSSGSAYNPRADRLSWQRMQSLFQRVFSSP